MTEIETAQAEIRRLRSVVRMNEDTIKAMGAQAEKVYGMLKENARNIIDGHCIGYEFRKYMETNFGEEV